VDLELDLLQASRASVANRNWMVVAVPGGPEEHWPVLLESDQHGANRYFDAGEAGRDVGQGVGTVGAVIVKSS
jgi:hypothetical protein